MTPSKHREKMMFCRILRFSKNELENFILCATSNLSKKLTKIATLLIFFPVKAESPYFSKRRRLLRIKLMRAPYLKKRRLYFLKKCNFAKNRKKAPKKAPFASMVLWMPGIEKAPFFWPRTNRVLNKGAFSSLKTRIYKLKRGFLECFGKKHECWWMATALA